MKYSFIILDQDIKKIHSIKKEIGASYRDEAMYSISRLSPDKNFPSDMTDHIDQACSEDLFTVLILDSELSYKDKILELFKDIADGMVAYTPGVILYTNEEDFKQEGYEIQKALMENGIDNLEVYKYSEAFLKLDEIQEEILTGEDQEIGRIYSDVIEDLPIN